MFHSLGKAAHRGAGMRPNKLLYLVIVQFPFCAPWTGGKKTRPDTRLPQSRAGGQGPYLRSLEHMAFGPEKVRPKTAKT